CQANENAQLAITTKSLSETCGVRMILAICLLLYDLIDTVSILKQNFVFYGINKLDCDWSKTQLLVKWTKNMCL
ncbi:hypothetical protein, partial [Leuconostoc falkenbergense]|uniref:hypothetical protein n=1 Tax=Leuconostoc falkenbergense TaxID=2766470 RepID=UPI0021AA6D66